MSEHDDCDGEWHGCPDCEAGYVLDDCFEDSCCCLHPELDHDVIPCSTCEGKGGWPCPDAVVQS
jgi:hypothetical protein